MQVRCNIGWWKPIKSCSLQSKSLNWLISVQPDALTLTSLSTLEPSFPHSAQDKFMLTLKIPAIPEHDSIQ